MKILKTSKPFIANLVQKSKEFIYKNNQKLKVLLKDTFCKEQPQIAQNIRHEGDTFKHTPEFILKDGDTAGITVQKVKFFPEDIKKMRKMSLEERIAYKSELKRKGLYKTE